MSVPRLRFQLPPQLAAILSYAAHVVPTVVGILVLNFFLLKLVPGDAADIAAAESGAATEETMAIYRHHFGLDVPVLDQFLNYLRHLAHFDLGYSARYNAPVAEVILSRLPATLLLIGASYLTALILGVLFGALMATFRNRWPDRLLNSLIVLAFSMPAFGVGLLLIILFSVQLGWLPSDGFSSLDSGQTGWGLIADRAAHLILPAIALSVHALAIYARLTRSTMLEVSQQDYVRTAQAKGVHPFWVTVRHVLRNALIPISTYAGLQLGSLLGNTATVEMVFSWPGIGRLSLEAVQSRDYPTLLGILLLTSLVIVAANILVDIVHYWIDPRTRRPAKATQPVEIAA